ncbi:protein-L-isoaspartate(D-aspartate) O-methyltransferase [Govanella unica]|uniref:Protein-L-isoaspartate O-methyltransferase n=1 Tax=Govanella unica TaxID=2975056 RepID=A0A9X3TWK7_9PROT|nr:protein-L-isoaspartate(D-aspartate) O-methyltransferase [Govania unica]MDA5193325.1 protein-L-isoaspartate(D-aspartate) O-methyltransferase [Govania unica]
MAHSDMDGDSAQKIALVMELRSGGIDHKILSIIETMPREVFVPPLFRNRAYENAALPIASGQTISQPYIVAYMTQLLDLGPRMKVLEIGTGSGYQAAVLARLCRRVYTIERYRTLIRDAEMRFATLNIHNITTRFADGSKGWQEQAPFDRILMTAAAPEVPEALVDQLKDDGVLVGPIGPESAEQMIVRVRKTSTGILREDLMVTRFVPLVAGVAREV